MEELHTDRLREPRHDLHQTAVGRVLWRQVRTERAAAGSDHGAHPGPYETSYDVARGYSADRPIDLP